MKKLLSVLAIAAMLASIWACKPTGGKEVIGDSQKQPDMSINSANTLDGKSPVPLDNAKELIQKYLTLTDSFSGGSTSVLVALKITTYEKLDELYKISDSKKLKMPDGQQYWDTGLSYVDYEKAITKYVTKELFEDIFMGSFGVVDGMLVDLIGGGGHSGNGFEVVGIAYTGKVDSFEQYQVRVYEGWTDNWNISESFFSAKLVQNENGYVLADIIKEKTGVKEPINSADSPMELNDVSKRAEYVLNLGQEASVSLKEALVMLGLTTRENLADAYNSVNGKKHPDGPYSYWETGVSYVDYEKVMMKYITKDLFKRKFIRDSEIIDDTLVVYGGTNEYKYSVSKSSYLGKTDSGEEYLIDSHMDDKKGIESNNKMLIRFIKDGSGYVVSEVLLVLEHE